MKLSLIFSIGLYLLCSQICAHPFHYIDESIPLPNPNAYSTPEILSIVEVISKYFILGFEHILPKGLDHILFVLGMFLLSNKIKVLFYQITIFTIAHSITLALSIHNIVSLSPSIVEPLIAISIAFVAIENVFTTQIHPWRPILILLFGLLHGLGFAGVLSDLGLPHGQFASALISFNIGVEIGQLTIIGLALLVLGSFRHKPWYRLNVVEPISIFIACVGFYWFIERIL